MAEERDGLLAQDSITKNVIVSAISQGVVLVAGLLTSSMLFRSLDISWTVYDYANYHALMNWNAIMLVFVLLGLTTAVIKTVSENAHDPQRIGVIITVALVVVTLTFTAITIVSLGLPDILGNTFNFLVGETPQQTQDLRLLWPLILISLLPSTFLYISRAAFSGLQRMQGNMIVDIVYGILRVAILGLLFIWSSINLVYILYMMIISIVCATLVSLSTLLKQLKAEGVRLHLQGWKEVAGPLLYIGGIFTILGLLSSFGNYIVPLLVFDYGTNWDMTMFSIANNLITTIRTFLAVPMAVLLPNIAGMYARGKVEDVKKRFDESNRIILPTLIFVFVTALTFGEAILGIIYGARAFDVSGGMSATQFLMAISPALIVGPLSGIYGNIVVATGKMKAALVVGAITVAVQVLWIVLGIPILGVMTFAYVWVAVVPIVVIFHFYTKRKFSLFISRELLSKAMVLLGAYFLIAWTVAQGSRQVIDALVFLPFMEYTILRSFLWFLFAIPLWYIFIGFSLVFRVMSPADIDNLEKFLKKIPPVWWVSKPIMKYLRKFGVNKEKSMEIDDISNQSI